MLTKLLPKTGRITLQCKLLLFAAGFFLAQSHLAAQTPELLYYRFDGSGTSIPNEASAPPSGTETATIIGDQTIGSTGQCNEALIGTGSNSSTNFVNTGWVPDLGSSSWTLSLWINNVPNYSLLWYIFGEVNTNGFRCFTNGVTGADNFWLRGGGLTDVAVNGGALAGPQVITFVYDNTLDNVKAYLNGVLVNTVAQGDVNITGTAPFKVGGYSSNSGLAPNSRMDEFRLYNRALSAAEVEALVGNICACYVDADGDGYGDAEDPGIEIEEAECPMGLVDNNSDCNDSNDAINPEATEICDNVDNDCSGVADDGDDLDGDGYSIAQGDCDDCNDAVNPGAAELCGNDIDDNCDNIVDAGFTSPGGVIFSEDFDNISGPTAGGPGTYTFPAGWLLANVDNRTPAGSVAYVNQAWERREDFIFNVADSCAFSTSWTSPAGIADDWMWTPLIGQITPGSVLKWKAVAPDAEFPDGYEVRVMPVSNGPPNGSDGNIGNMVSNSTIVFSIAAENSSWTDREVDLSGYAGQSVYIAFRNTSNDQFLLLIDDIEVTGNGITVEPEPVTFYADGDGDGYGNPNAPQESCIRPQGYVLNNTDCNDNNDSIYPGSDELCDGVDNDCNGQIDDSPVGGLVWSNSNVGNANGSATFPICEEEPEDVFTVGATGFSTSSSDVLHLVHQQLCGNGEIIAHVSSVNGGGWAGVTLRETLSPGSKNVGLKTQLTNNIRRMIRMVTNGAANNLNLFRPQHTWFRLVRNGSNFTGYTSVNGTTWAFAFSTTISMTGCIYAGVFSESVNGNVTTTAVFDNVSVTNPVIPLATPAATLAETAAPDLEVYPNPTTGEITVNLNAYGDRIVRIEIYDAQGKAQKVQELNPAETSSLRLDLSEYPNGIYLIRASSEGIPNVAKRVVLNGIERP